MRDRCSIFSVALAALVLCGWAPANAHASFSLVHPNRPDCAKGIVRQIGAGNPYRVPSGSSGSVPLSVAAKLLVPAGWTVRLGRGVTSVPVHWAHHETWVQALTSGQAACYTVDWKQRVLEVARNPHYRKAAFIYVQPFSVHAGYANRVAMNHAHGKHGLSYIPKGEAPLGKALGDILPPSWTWQVLPPVALSQKVKWHSAPNWKTLEASLNTGHHGHWQIRCEHHHCRVLPDWRVKGGSTAMHTLFGWAHKVGWHVIWNPNSDWTLAGSTQWYGSFSHAVTRLVKTLGSQGIPITVEIWRGNKTIVVNDSEGNDNA